MDISKLLVRREPVARKVKFSDGTVETLYFIEPDGGEFRLWREAESSDDDSVRAYSMQRLIARSLVDKDGNRILTDEQATGLTVQGLNDLFPHVMAVARIEDSTKKASPSAAESGSAAS